MGLMWLVDIILFLLLIYFVFIHEYVLGKRKFKCLRCGKCCSLRINLPKEDIIKIKKAGYNNFIEGKNKLKKVNGYCIFMNLENGITSCKLENSAKPQICVNFPHRRGIFGSKVDYRCSSFCKFN